VSSEIHFLILTWIFFLETCEALNDGHCKHFHLDVSKIEKINRGKWSSRVLANGNNRFSQGLCTNGRRRGGAFNQGKPVSVQFVTDILSKACITEVS
jgi:hypothetical protein